MENLIKFSEQIFELKNAINRWENLPFLEHVVIPNCILNPNTVSIVMCSTNRTKQVYFTLNSIMKSKYKNIQIILVDDSDTDCVDINVLQKYHFYIDFIKIKREHKCWFSPLVNYNIGFKLIKGKTVIIQNSEVFYVGDIVSFLNTTIKYNEYFVFDVKPSRDFDTNEVLYNVIDTDNIKNIYNLDVYNHDIPFYQGRTRNVQYHFLTAMTAETFRQIKEFSWDMTYGLDYDDNDFLLKIKANNINIKCIHNDEYNIGGIHLFHGREFQYVTPNRDILERKLKFFEKFKSYLDFTQEYNTFNNKINFIL